MLEICNNLSLLNSLCLLRSRAREVIQASDCQISWRRADSDHMFHGIMHNIFCHFSCSNRVPIGIVMGYDPTLLVGNINQTENELENRTSMHTVNTIAE